MTVTVVAFVAAASCAVLTLAWLVVRAARISETRYESPCFICVQCRGLFKRHEMSAPGSNRCLGCAWPPQEVA